MADIPPIEVQGTPDEVVARMQRVLPEARSIWLPTPADLRAWNQSHAPLYLRRVDRHTVDLGPRLQTMAAARFTPVLRTRIEPMGSGRSRLAFSPRPPQLTGGLVVGWAIVLATWLFASILPEIAAGASLTWLLWWGVLAGSTAVGAALGWTRGLALLRDAVPWLRDRVDADLAVEEDW